MLSSRISSKRRSYKSSDRRRRKDGEDIINEIDASGDDGEESVERKLARLRREILEVKAEVENQRAGPNGPAISGAQALSGDEEIDGLGQLLKSIDPPAGGESRNAANRLTKRLSPPTDSNAFVVDESPLSVGDREEHKSGSTATNDPNDHDIHSLSLVADFDARLGLLEKALGIDALPLPTQTPSPVKPLLPTLDTLDKQLSTLSISSEVSLDKIKSRVRELAQEAESLERKRGQAKRALETPGQGVIRAGLLTANGETQDADTIDAEQISKVNALYGTLNTIDSLAPLLPSVLDRLRSLKGLHTEAAMAGQSLARIETKQDDMRQELHGWRDGLEKVEKAMQQGEEYMKENAEVMEEWIRGLEERMRSFG